MMDSSISKFFSKVTTSAATVVIAKVAENGDSPTGAAAFEVEYLPTDDTDPTASTIM